MNASKMSQWAQRPSQQPTQAKPKLQETFYDAPYKNMGRGGTTLGDEISSLV